MTDKPLVSVIIIFLNAEKFIQEAIESVFAQTYDGWELLLVDDGSTDGSTEIACRYAEAHPNRLRYLEHAAHQNRGKSASRNLGFNYAQGEYVAFLDADDVWLPHKLEQQVAIMESYPEAAMVYGLSQWWYSWTGKPEDRCRDFVHELGVPANTLIKPPLLFTPFFLRQGAAIPNPSNILLRRKILAQVGGFEDSFQGVYDVYEDQAFYAKVCLTASVFASSECWDRYRQHPRSSCAVVQRMGKEYAVRLFFLNWLASHLYEQRVTDPEIWLALRREQWRCRHPRLYGVLERAGHAMRQVKLLLQLIAQRVLPGPVRLWFLASWQGHSYSPPVGWVHFGSLRRVTPISRTFGFDRGLPIDRYYIERFLSFHASDIRGRALEIGDNTYTRELGGNQILTSDVLHVNEGNPKATIVANLTRADHIPADTFDCIICTQTLQFISDPLAALRTLHRILKPGGVLLVTFSGISQISRYDMETWGYDSTFTIRSARQLFETAFPGTDIRVEAFGNVLAATAFLYGLAAHELLQEELDYHDPDYELLITVRAVK